MLSCSNKECVQGQVEEVSPEEVVEPVQDEEISKIAWEKYGFRTGITGGNYDVSKMQMKVPGAIKSTVSSLKMDYYDKLIEYLKN